MRFAILPVLTLALLSTVAPGQSTQHAKAEISGVVLDPTTHEAVAGAEIALFTQEPGSAPVNGGWKADESTRAKTDDDGAFAISPTKLGSYRVQASKPGWGPSSSAQN